MTGAQVLAVGGILSAIVGTAGGYLNDARVIGAASAIMLLANAGALLAERRRRK